MFNNVCDSPTGRNMELPAISTNGRRLLVTNLGLGRTFRGPLILPINLD